MKMFLAAILAASAMYGYIRRIDPGSGMPIIRTDNTAIQFYVNSEVAPGLANRSGSLIISKDSSPVTAAQQAMASWNASGANIKFLPIKTTTSGADSSDSKNVIVFSDTDANRALVNGAVAVTPFVYTLDDFHIVDSDIVFNPEIVFSTSGVAKSQDIQSVMAHELGHALGSNHSNLLGATMFQSGTGIKAGAPDGYTRRILSSEDLAFANAAYPGPNSSVGTISGTVTLSGAPAKSALLTMMDLNSGVMVGGMTGPDGKYSLTIPAGSYLIYAEPFNAIVAPGNLYITDASTVTQGFLPTFFGSNASPTPVSVAKGGTAAADIQVTAGATKLTVPFMFTATAGQLGGLTALYGLNGALSLTSGQSADLVFSTGVAGDTILANSGTDVRVYGKGIKVRPGTVRVDNTYQSSGLTLLRVAVDVDTITTPTLASVLLVRSDDALALSGTLILLPAPPVFTSGSVTNSASFATGAVSPGAIISIFGTSLGPTAGWNSADFGFDSSTNALPTTLGGVKVTFDGVLAPVFYASSGLVNVQVPFEVAGKSATNVVVSYNGLDSATVTLPVTTATPGIYTYNGSGKGLGIVVNQDYTLNTASNPAAQGSVVTIYLTGRGAVNYPVQTGKAVSAPPTLDSGGFTCTIGGTQATVAFGGWTPTAVGLAQANVYVPSSSTTGELPLTLNIGSASSQAGVTLFVK